MSIVRIFDTYENHLPINNLKMVIDSSGSYMAVTSDDNLLRIRKFKSGKTVAEAYAGEITGLFFTFDNKHIMISNSDACIMIWKLTNKIKVNLSLI